MPRRLLANVSHSAHLPLGTETNIIRTITTTEFQTTCLDLLDGIGADEITSVTISKHGRPIAIVTAPAAAQHPFDVLYGMMPGSVIAPPDVDFTAPVFERATRTLRRLA